MEDTTPREMSQSQKDKYCMRIDEVSEALKFIDTESRMVVTTGWGKGSRLVGIEFQICKMKKFWKSISQSCEYS